MPPKIGSRQIRDVDLAEVVELLWRGFGAARTREFWQNVLDRLGTRSVPADFPRYGYVLECDGKLVGVYLEIFSKIWSEGKADTRCNVSSLYVDPRYRIYAPLLEAQMFKRKDVTL